MKRNEEAKPSLTCQDDKQETGWRVRVRNVMRVVGGHRKPPKRKTEAMNKFYVEEKDTRQTNDLVSDGGDRMMLEAAEEEYGIIPRSRIIRGHKVLIYTLPNANHLRSKGACEGVATGGVGDEESSGNSCCETSQETLFRSEVHVESRIGGKESTEKKDGRRSGGLRISRNAEVVETSDGGRISRKVPVPDGLGEVEISGTPAEGSVGQKVSQKVTLSDRRNEKEISGISSNGSVGQKISSNACPVDSLDDKGISGISGSVRPPPDGRNDVRKSRIPAEMSVGQRISSNACPADSSDDKGISGISGSVVPPPDGRNDVRISMFPADRSVGQKISRNAPLVDNSVDKWISGTPPERSAKLKISRNAPVPLEEKKLSTNDKRSHPVRLKKRISRNNEACAVPPSKIPKIHSVIQPKDVHTSQKVIAWLNQSKTSHDSVVKLNKSLSKGMQLDLEDPAQLQEEIAVVPESNLDQPLEGDCVNVNSHCQQINLNPEMKKPVSLFQSPKLCVSLEEPCSQQMYFGPNPPQLDWSHE